jgi:hypothetical protein
MTWDATNSRLGIGTNAPTAPLDVRGGFDTNIKVTSSAGGFSGIQFGDTVDSVRGAIVYSVSNNRISIRGYDNTDRLTVTDGGNILINSSTDSGERLQVTGNVLINGASGNVFFVKSSGGNNLFYIQNAGTIGFTAYTWTPESTSGSVTLTASASRSWNVTGDKTNTSGVGSAFFVTSGFAPTSGTGQYNAQTINPTINQTGGANGITRGLYVNPTLTAAADFRAIETARGNVVFGNLPTSPVGLPTGAIWNNLGMINIV